MSNTVKYQFLSSYFEIDGIRYVPVSPSEKTCDAIDCVYDESAANTKIASTVAYKGVSMNVKNIQPYLAYNNKFIKSLAVDYDGELPNYAFTYCSNMQSATLSQKVSAIGSYAFQGCSSLEAIEIPDIVTVLNDYAFQGCSSLKEVKLGSQLKTINQYTFGGCSALPFITIPSEVTNIYNNVFYDCTGLKIVNIADSESTLTFGSNGSNPLFSSCPLDYVYIGRDISYSTSSSYGYSPFYRNTSLREVKITNKETEISENEFYGCTNLQKITIGDGVTTIGKRAFSGASSLKYFAFGSQVAEIGEEAFSDCAAMVEVISKAKTAPACGNQALDDINKFECKLYVPDGCMAVYEAADQWKEFFFKDYAKVELNKTKAAIENGKTLTLKATVTPSDLSDKSVTWKSSNKSVATVTSAGKVKGVKAGTATITCTSTMTGAKATCKVTVTENSFELDKTEAVLEKGKTMTLTPTVYPSSTDKTVTWESSNTKVATVTSAGMVKGVKTGTATITCTSNSTGAKATCKVTVGSVKLDKTEATILKGKTTTLTATVYPTSLKDKSVTWESSNTAVATVTTAGKVKGVKAGTATITCTSNATGLKATCTVNVVKGFVTLNKTETYVQKGKTMTLNATVTPESLEDKSVTWESSDTKIATVTSAGKVKGVKYGTATITCTSVATGAKATCQVTVGKVVISISEVSIKKSRGITLEATIYPTDLADKSVTWESSDPSIATVNENGRVKGVKAGTATITCTSVATGLKGTCTVTVLSNSEARSMIGDDDELTGIKELESPAVPEPFDVYDQSGRKVRHQVTSLDGLPDGIYIVNGKKILKKKSEGLSVRLVKKD
ncbi:MAG: Ig-like domain-containing protein [Prevotella sp.]|nr:Ig-like domain-containing protein [Prevotella sp.]